MLKNYFSIAFRHLLRDLKTTTINIVGLSVGISSFFLIMLWVNYQLSMNGFHENLSQIYTVMADRSQDTRVSIQPNTPFPLGEVLREQAGIRRLARIMTQDEILLVSRKHKQEEYIHFTDPDFLDIFSYTVIDQTDSLPLSDPFSIMMTEDAYQKYFGDAPLRGQTVHMKSWGFEADLKVTGILENIPGNSSVKFSYLIPIELLRKNIQWLNNWGTASLITYVQLNEGISADELSAQITDIPGKHHTWQYELFLFPYAKGYLYNVFHDRHGTGRIIYVYIFIAAAILILVLACINFTNLATAQAGRRAREIGVRKTMGAQVRSVRLQVILEGIILALIAAGFSLTIIQLILPFYNDLLQTNFEAGWISFKYVLLILGIAVLTGALAAAYPAFIYARFNPARVLKSNFASGTKLHWSKQVLLIFQLVMSVIMISSAIVIYRQVNYLNNSDLGFKKDNLMYFYIHEKGAYGHHEDFARRLESHPSIGKVTYLSQNPLQVYQTSGDPEWDGKNPETAYPPFSFIDVDYGVEEVLDLEIIAGRSFSPDIATDTASFLINERAAALIGEDPIGKTMKFWDKEGRIIGVFRDFHHLSLHNKISPMILRYWRENTNMAFLRIGGNVAETRAFIKKEYEKYESEYPFTYNFVDDEFEGMYTAEKQIRSLTIIFAIMVILISILGLYGLVAYVLQGQIKMIGIRKVMGATTGQMVRMFIGRFSLWVVYAIVFAVPVSYFLLDSWLENFAYRINIAMSDFILGAVLMIGITIVTILFRVVRASSVNPAETLKNE